VLECDREQRSLETVVLQMLHCERRSWVTRGACLHMPLDVLSQDVALQIDGLTWLAIAQVGVLVGVGNHRDLDGKDRE
jgi:hypothetical protein